MMYSFDCIDIVFFFCRTIIYFAKGEVYAGQSYLTVLA
jgi:hypothetical protein